MRNGQDKAAGTLANTKKKRKKNLETDYRKKEQ
jgi:hypothetical protein